MFESAYGEPLLDPKLLHQEERGLNDVYNYAARFGYVPKVTIRPFAGRANGHKTSRMEVTIELPQQNIKAAAIGSVFELTQAAAVVRFKRQAEVYHADNESTKSTVSRVPALSTYNVHEFLKFSKIHHGDIKLSLVTKRIHLPDAKPYIHSPDAENSYFQAVVLVDGEQLASPALHLNKKEASSLAFLAAGVILLANNPILERGFSKALKMGNGKILHPAQVNTTVVEEDCLIAMQDTIQEMRKTGFPDDTEQYQPDIEPLEERRRIRRYELTGGKADRKSKELNFMLEKFKGDPRHENLRSKLQDLPMNQYHNKVLDIVQNNNYSVIIGATGSGKTTQVPQILLNHAVEEGYGAHCNIICTQPRRIAASSVARRVSQERGEQLRESVGYHVRFDPQLPKVGGSITYSTTGILLVQLQHAPDEIFDSVSHIIIDEIHERDVEVDFLLILLKNIVKRRQQANQSVPKIVLMSATIDADLFAEYFQNESLDGALARCPTLNVPGRTFPVKERYLEDLVQQFSATYEPEELEPLLSEKATATYLDDIEAQYQSQPEDIDAPCQGDDGNFETSSIDWDNIHAPPPSSQRTGVVNQEDPLIPLGLACATIAHIARTSQEGAILVFLPGLNEIDTLQKMLMEEPRLGVDFSNSDDYRIFKLHSSIPATENDVFEPLPGRCRKIILSTNIAETSVTIPDVQYVVDSGKSREKIYDHSRRISKLACCWFSKSNAKQRAGRAGRVQNGNYYALYTRQKFNSLRAVGVPEILRIDLQEVCLRVKSQSFQTPIREFLAQALEPPSLAQVDASVHNLQALEALDEDEEVTALGRLLAQLPVHPSLGKMIILGIVFRCLDPMIVMGAIGGERSLWNLTLGSEERSAASQVRLDYIGQSNSEHIGTLNAFKDARQVLYKAGKDAAYEHCNSKFMKFMPFRNILRSAHQIREILEEAQLIPAGKRDGFELGGPDLNVNSSCIPLIKALLTSGMFPNIAVSTHTSKAFSTEGESGSKLHPRCLLDKKLFIDKMPNPGKLIVFSSLQKLSLGQKLFLTDVGQITPLVAMLFGGRLTGKGDIVTMDSWLPFDIQAPKGSIDVPYKPAKMVIEFRKALDRVSTNNLSNPFIEPFKLTVHFD